MVNGRLFAGSSLAILSGLMNGAFTLPMRFLGRWEWENVWSIFIFVACLLLPTAIVGLTAPQSWAILAQAPGQAVGIAILSGFAWGFGAILFGQSVSAMGISLANTLVLAISSALGALLPLVLLQPQKLMGHTGGTILAGVAVEVVAIALCGRAGWVRERAAGSPAQRGAMVGRARTMRIALLMAIGAGLLSAVFNIGFSLAQPVAAYGRSQGLSDFSSTNLIWWIMLGAGSVANLGFCLYLLNRNRSMAKFRQSGSVRLYTLAGLMAVLWGGSIFVYGAATPRLGSLGTSIGWPLSLATGLLLANVIGISLGEWKGTSSRAKLWMYSGIPLLVVAILILSRAGD